MAAAGLRESARQPLPNTEKIPGPESAINGISARPPPCGAAARYSTVTLFARFLGWSTSVPFSTAT